MTDPEPTQRESDSDREPSRASWSGFDDLSPADKLGYIVAAAIVTLAGLGIAFLIYVVATALVTWLLGG